MPPGLHYAIDVRLDPLRQRLSGHATIRYRSGADSALGFIYLHAYPNAFRGPHTIMGREGERWGEDYALRFAPAQERGWMTMDSVFADGRPATVTLDETVARIDLPRPLDPGDSVTLELRFDVQVPIPFNRFGHAGEAYTIGQWYPKVAVHDDRGWHPDPYHYFAEFYGDYGTFDVAITLPDRYWVGATGVLTGASGGDNEIPLADAETPNDSVTVVIRATPGDSLLGQWPQSGLEIEPDLMPPGDPEETAVEVDRESGARLRVPRGAPVHYAYRWTLSKEESLEEADDAGRAGPLHYVVASRDTAIIDTLRALAPQSAPGDSASPSLKTLRFHAERVHDFAWVACPDYVRSDTTVLGISIRALAFRDDQRLWAGQKAVVASVIEFMSREVGPYIWPTFTSAEAYMGGGAMEYPMLITNEPDRASSWIALLDITIAHETIHNWFYGMLGSDERAYAWLDEGFTEHMEHRYVEWKYPRGLFKKQRLLPWVSPVLDFLEDENRYLARAWARDEQRSATPADSSNGWPTYGVSAYSKPSMMLRALRGYLGESKYSAFLHEYYRRNLLKHPRPEDVVAAAEAIDGRDLKGWFRPWIESTEAVGFAVGRIHRERDGNVHRTMVEVRRTEPMQALVTARATFADGTVRDGRVYLAERRNAVLFVSGARLRSVVLDPLHEIPDVNRLDNRSGGPPLRFKPLYDFRSSEAMTFFYGPMVWHGRAEGARLGVWASGRYLSSIDFPEGILSATGNLVVGMRGGAVSWRAGLGRRVGSLGARGRLALEGGRDAGLLDGGIAVGNNATAPGRRHPFRSWTLGAQYRDRYDLAPVDPRYWSPGRSAHLTGRFTLETQGPRRAEHGILDMRHGFSAFRPAGDRSPDVSYDRASLEVRQTLDLLPRGNAHFTWRFFAGSAFRRVPRELLFDAAEGSRLDSRDRFHLNDRGPLLASGHSLIPGGGGMRGYRGRAALGKRVWGASIDFATPPLPVSPFADVGRVETTGLGESDASASAPGDLTGRMLADAGVALEVGPLTFVAPLWVGRPDRDERPWRFRWLVSIGSIRTPF